MAPARGLSTTPTQGASEPRTPNPEGKKGEFEGVRHPLIRAGWHGGQGRISRLIRTRSGCPSVSRGHERRGSRGAAPRLSLRSKVYQVRLMDINLWTAFY